ncbi:hypothetical protein J3369_19290 [Alteromonas sp. NFXS44]|uniref:hypothetical protein n=1 Tax=Alteromonas sp. NFXS44 TaxID=2818435 RepID=UPI0032E02D80
MTISVLSSLKGKQWDGLLLNLNRRPFFGQYGDDELPIFKLGEASKIPETIATVIKALENGELDSYLLSPAKSSKKPAVAKASQKAKA